MRNSPSQRSTSSLPTAVDNNRGSMSRPRSEADLMVSMNALNLNRGPSQLPSLPLPPIPTQQPHAAPAVMQNFPTPPPLRYYRSGMFHPLTLHPRAHGMNVRLGADCRTAVRNESEFCNGYVFSSRPISAGESWVVQVGSLNSIHPLSGLLIIFIAFCRLFKQKVSTSAD